jgi:pyruvate kinase
VRSGEDIRRLQQHIHAWRAQHPDAPQAPGVVAKIERPEALQHFEDILAVTDAVMVARGDLGMEADLDDVPQVQKDLIRQCNDRGIPVITATQMLESMTDHPQPTRAEVSDVANAIYDGTDAVMLSGETAAGRFPVETVRVMADIALKADRAVAALAEDRLSRLSRSPFWRGSYGGAIAEAVNRMTRALDIARIVCFTKSGYTARAIARYRPQTPVTAITMTEETLRRCALVWGVEALQSVEVAQVDEMVPLADALVTQHGLARPGETILIVGGTPLAVGGVTNFLKLHTVGGSA